MHRWILQAGGRTQPDVPRRKWYDEVDKILPVLLGDIGVADGFLWAELVLELIPVGSDGEELVDALVGQGLLGVVGRICPSQLADVLGFLDQVVELPGGGDAALLEREADLVVLSGGVEEYGHDVLELFVGGRHGDVMATPAFHVRVPAKRFGGASRLLI